MTPFAFSHTYAEEIYSEDDEAIVFNSLDEYIEYSIPRHLYAQSIVIDGTLSYSHPVSLYDFDNGSVIGSEIFIFDDEELIGKTEVYNSGDEYMSTFDTYITADIDWAYQTGEEIAVGYVNNTLFMYSDSEGYVYIDGFENYDLPSGTPLELSAITVWNETSADFAVSYSVATARLNVIHVPNSLTYNGNGECWAACIAMKLNYQMGYNLDADTVFEAADSLGLLDWNFDYGLVIDLSDESAVYSHYGYNVTETSNRLTHGEVYNILRSGKPLAISINNSNDDKGHKIIIKGITLDAASSTYIFDDPNTKIERTTILNGNPSQTYPSFSYPYGNNGNGYNNWRYTIY